MADLLTTKLLSSSQFRTLRVVDGGRALDTARCLAICHNFFNQYQLDKCPPALLPACRKTALLLEDF